jgi:hypothetical protein
MFARILQFEFWPEKKEEFVKVVKNEVLPILRKQTGFLELLPFFPEKMEEKVIFTISLWATKTDAERYEKEIYPKVYNILKPYIVKEPVVKPYMVETRLCEHFVGALTA